MGRRGPALLVRATVATQWWQQDDAVDAQIHDRFLALHKRLAEQADDSLGTPHSLLAAVIVLDQFSRNLFRSTPRAYAADPIARRPVLSGFTYWKRRVAPSALTEGMESRTMERFRTSGTPGRLDGSDGNDCGIHAGERQLSGALARGNQPHAIGKCTGDPPLYYPR